MFVSVPAVSSRLTRSKRWVALVAAAVAMIVIAAGTVIANADEQPTSFPAQGARWDRAVDVNKSPYVLKTPNVGAARDRGQPLYYGVVAWQQLLNANGAKLTVDGSYGPQTQQAVKNFQRSKGIEPSGVVGYPTAKALLDPVVNKHAKRVGMSTGMLMCHIAAESALDPSAVGLNGSDMGIAQISLPHNPGVTAKQAFDVEFAIKYVADRDAKAYKTYKDWNIAVASYNSPAAANQWKRTGAANDLAGKYAQRVMNGC